MAPLTLEGAAFKKDGRPDTWPIMNRILHNIENLALNQNFTPLDRP